MLFDRFGPAQAGNGQAIPNQQATAGAPGLQLGSWGHQPNFAGGMQQFLRPGMMGQPAGGAGGVMGQPGQAQPGGPQMSTGFMPPPVAPGTQAGMPTATGPAGIAAGLMPQGASTPMMGASGPMGGNTNMASGMQQYLGRPS